MKTTSNTDSSTIDFNSPQLTTTNGAHHKQMTGKLVKPYRKEIERTCQKIQDESKNKQPKVHFLLFENDQPLHIEFNLLGYSESEYHKICFAYAVGNRWIRTNHSDFDKQYFRFMSDLTRGILQRKKSHHLVVVVNGYICECVIISTNASPKGFGRVNT